MYQNISSVLVEICEFINPHWELIAFKWSELLPASKIISEKTRRQIVSFAETVPQKKTMETRNAFKA